MIQAALPGQNKLQYRQTYFIFFRPIRRKTMISFFKRKKKPETPETAPEQNAQPVETAESAPAITAPEHTHTEPGHIPVTQAKYEQPRPLIESSREAWAAD